MSILNNQIRVGNFSSSEIVALTKLGKIPMTEEELRQRPKSGTGSKTIYKEGGFADTALTYIQEKNWERRLGRSLSIESNAKPLTWGKLLEKQVDNKLGIAYSLISQDTVVHQEIDFWVGSPDSLKVDEGRTIVDIKCPLTLTSFCQLVTGLYNGLEGMAAMNYARENHKEGDTYYWQLVSNSILKQTRYAELAVYVPYESDLPTIKALADGEPNCYWITMGLNEELPFIKDGGYYQDLNIIRFEVPQEDKDFLTERVKEAGKFLINQNITQAA